MDDRLYKLYQARAVGAVSYAIKCGKLASPKGQSCADCGGPATEYDHRDYGFPLWVTAVCRSCNLRRGSAAVTGAVSPEKATLLKAPLDVRLAYLLESNA